MHHTYIYTYIVLHAFNLGLRSLDPDSGNEYGKYDTALAGAEERGAVSTTLSGLSFGRAALGGKGAKMAAIEFKAMA